ncbi:hypothetical protein ACPOL_4010 [Acidisarcina polymorpha]|uniref:O-methyltransferase C-terminal domain-containing protein n=2 Tax=Acidisarcina polymorpha TaxID=2211140 RepID=A0A2Z5G2M0_9BACT|nr:hypothetical protein ACPOL_4010 [Acidisarcina polymorpha]
MTDIYFGGGMKDLHRRVYLSDALYRLDHWKQQTGARFLLRELAIPEIGNPFGVSIDGTLVAARSEFQHYCAARVGDLLESAHSTIVEIGGGFGGMAYYLMRDRPKIKYLDFDLPESIALATYYLMNALPQKRFLLFGERPLTMENMAASDIVLMPLFQMESLQTASADLTFSCHAMTDIDKEELASYLATTQRVTRNHFLFVGTRMLSELPGMGGLDVKNFQLKEQRQLRWNSHRQPRVEEVECLYSFHHAAENMNTAERDLAHVDR